MSDDTPHYACCVHCDDGAECTLTHEDPCDYFTCPGSVPVGPTKEGKQ